MQGTQIAGSSDERIGSRVGGALQTLGETRGSIGNVSKYYQQATDSDMRFCLAIVGALLPRSTRRVRILFLASVLALPLPAVAVAQTLYRSAGAAHQHCPHDTVVWLNTPTGIYHFKGERWYGRTRHGAFVCQHEANTVGDRATRNGQ